MNFEGLDLVQLSKVTTEFVEEVQCLECCKYYIAPATAACGHSLCHTCWIGRRSCPDCGMSVNRKALKLNIPLQTLTHHVQTLVESFEKLFHIKLDNIFLETPGEADSVKDRDKNVKNWLTSSQNHFSATIENTDPFSQESQQIVNPVEISTNNIIIHTDTKKVISPKKIPKVVHVTQSQNDWDKIESMPDIENKPKSSENIVGPMDIEPFFVDDIEYNSNNLRRSSRKKDVKENCSPQTYETIHHKLNTRQPNCEKDKRSQKPKQNWGNVKKMKKDFNKLKVNKSKLNVSIDMVKNKKNIKSIDKQKSPMEISQPIPNIDENTPSTKDTENQIMIGHSNDHTEKVQDSVSSKENDISIKNDNSIKVITPANSSKIYSSKAISVINKNYSNILTSNPKTITPSTESKCHLETGHKIEQFKKAVAKMPFIKKSTLCPRNIDAKSINCEVKQQINADDSEDIEISIKVRNIITNIVITKKNDVQVKTHIEREVQTSTGPENVDQNESPPKEGNVANITVNKCSAVNTNTQYQTNIASSSKIENKVDKFTSEKKNTASADTVTAQFEITESVEKELLNEMEYETVQTNDTETVTVNEITKVQPDIAKDDNDKVLDDVIDVDLFHTGSVMKEQTPSEILTSTVRSRLQSQRNVEKRNRNVIEEEILPKTKKAKTAQEIHAKNTLTDSEAINYDAIMGQVFANIDADIEGKQDAGIMKVVADQDKINTQSQLKNNDESEKFKSNNQNDVLQEYFNEKNSENIFTNFEKIDENSAINKNYSGTQHAEDLLTPVFINKALSQESHDGIQKTNKSNRKLLDCDDSDRSVVEETPQKQVSIPKLKRANTSNLSQNFGSGSKKVPAKASPQNILHIPSDGNRNEKEQTVVEILGNVKEKHTPETPPTIKKFAGDVIHKSTPIARKSLNYDDGTQDNNDPEETFFPLTDVVAKTTLEKEFMSKAFEKTPKTPGGKSLLARNVSVVNRNYCLAGSCLTLSEIAVMKRLCAHHKWTYVDKYTNDITHLVVGVDEENKSQRSIKYMCALAASKWIVSFDWITSCIKSKSILNEVDFEALDNCGEPGPRRSRIAKQKLFQGITFYCMPPFSVLDINVLKGMLLAAGGRVVNNIREVKVPDGTREPALLLAEPEHTQEDRFIYLAMENGIVPVNYEWALNCLGSYTLKSIQYLLLCPSTLLPSATTKWPEVLLFNEEE